MEYIDKEKSREWAQQLIREFLDWLKNESETYPEDLYIAFRADTPRKDSFIERLLEDNNHRCCYCMRDLKGTTLEHMIPQSVKTRVGYDRYFKGESSLDANNIVLAQEYLNNPQEVPPFPHTIAYENLIPSCFGDLPYNSAKCCNNHRKDRFIHPLVFRPTIHEEVKYYQNGDVVWTEDSEYIEPTITTLGLDCLELKAIRRIWYYLANKGIGCEGQNSMQMAVDDLLIEIGTPSNSEEKAMQQMLMNFKKDEYWGLLKKYTYFNNTELYEKE